jgi:hypothetical protein
MKRHICFLIAAALFLTGRPIAEAADQSEAIKQAVLEVHARMGQATETLDADKLFGFILDGGPGTIIQNGEYFETPSAALDSVRRGLRGVAKAERTFDRTEVTVLAPDVALLTGAGLVRMTLDDGRNLSSRFAVTTVFVHRNGEWKVLHGHHSVPPAR